MVGVPEDVGLKMDKLRNAGFEAYIVGGAIRDYKLGKEPKDWDIFTNASGNEILKLFPQGKVIGNEERQNKILTVVVDGIEISQYRANGDRTETGNNLMAHLSTCDFTINAMASNGSFLIDPHCGMGDLTHHCIRCVGNAEERFNEDYLRLLRAIRFMSKLGDAHFSQQTYMAFEKQKSNILKLPAERVRDEILKTLAYEGGYENLKDFGIFTLIFPQILDLEITTGGQHHNEDNYTHSNGAFKIAHSLTDNVLLKIACALHDVGKPSTKSQEGEEIHFFEHEVVGADIVEDWMNKYKFSKEDIKYVTTLIRLHMYSYKDNPSKKSYIRFFAKLEEAHIKIEDYIILIYSDHQANRKKPRIKFGDFIAGNWLYKKYYECKFSKEPFSVKDLEISGHTLMDLGIQPGPIYGEILENILEAVLDGHMPNRADRLIEYVKNIYLKEE